MGPQPRKPKPTGPQPSDISLYESLDIKALFNQFVVTDSKHMCNRGWAFETVKDFELKKYSKKSVKVMSRVECMQLCLSEKQFECRSANFNNDIKICWLSDMDRNTVNANEDSKTKVFEPSIGSVDYIENNCIQGMSHWKPFPKLYAI